MHGHVGQGAERDPAGDGAVARAAQSVRHEHRVRVLLEVFGHVREGKAGLEHLLVAAESGHEVVVLVQRARSPADGFRSDVHPDRRRQRAEVVVAEQRRERSPTHDIVLLSGRHAPARVKPHAGSAGHAVGCWRRCTAARHGMAWATLPGRDRRHA